MAPLNYKTSIISRGYSIPLPQIKTTRKAMQWQGLAMKQVLPGISHQTINGEVVPIAYNCLNYRVDPQKELTASIIKADIGGVGGHVVVHPHVMQAVQQHIFANSKGMISSFFVAGAGDDISINLIHQRGARNPDIHMLCYEAFEQAVETARQLGLYGPGQDLPLAGKALYEKTGNVQGAGPSAAELNLDPKQSQSQVIFVWSDKTDPGSYSIPLWRIFNNINMQDSEMLAFSNARFGYWFMIQDVELKDAAREMGKTPEEVAEMGSGLMMFHSGIDNRMITTLLSDRDRYAVKAVYGTDEEGNLTRVVAAVSTDKLHNIGGEYLGKDDPVMIMLGQKDYPAPGEIIRAGWSEPFLVAGNCRGSHYAVLMPSTLFGSTNYSSNPIVTSATVSVYAKTGFIGGMTDNFFGPAWDTVRAEATKYDLWFHRAHGPFQPKVLPKGALEYQKGFMEALERAARVRRYFDLTKRELDSVARELSQITMAARTAIPVAKEETGPDID